MNVKIRWLRDRLKLQNIDGMIISNVENIKYLTGIEAEGLLLITKKENILLIDNRYIEEAHNNLTIEDEIIAATPNSYTAEDYKYLFYGYENVGFEEYDMSYANYTKIQQKYQCNNLIETDRVIERLRVIKEEEEIENIKTACEITDKCFSHLLKFIKKGMSEKEIVYEIKSFFVKNGAEDVSFEPIVATGPNSSKPHAKATDRKIEQGDAILIDMGCKVNGYCSDMTRTIFMGEISDAAKKVYQDLLKDYNLVIAQAKEGKIIKDLSLIVDTDFDLKNYQIMHSLGHGIGLECHEIPYINQLNQSGLKENMVIAIEPGAYFAGKFGIRLENTIWIKKTECVELTKSDMNIIII